MSIKEPTFDIDIYRKPKLLSDRESVAQIILHALFLKPGNLPDNPSLGVDIEKYMYLDSDISAGDNIRSALINTCGDDLDIATINSVSFITRRQEGEDNKYIFLIKLNITFVEDDTTVDLGIGGYQQSGNVTYNWDYLDSDYENI